MGISVQRLTLQILKKTFQTAKNWFCKGCWWECLRAMFFQSFLFMEGWHDVLELAAIFQLHKKKPVLSSRGMKKTVLERVKCPDGILPS